MSDTLYVLLLTAIGFLAVILSFALSRNINNKIAGVCGGTAVITGIFFYSYGYSFHEGFSIPVVIKTLLMTFRMFSGSSDYGTVAGTPLFQNSLIVTLFWIGHFMAFYMTGSAAVRILGKRVLKNLRTRMLRKGDIRLVYDAAPESICLAGQRKKGHPIMLVTEQSSESISARIDSLGGVEFPGGIALCTGKKFLKSIGIKGSRRKLDVYCIGNDPVKNLRYAQELLPGLQERRAPPEALSLFLLGVPGDRASRLLAMDGTYGYGTMFACSQYDLIARLIVEKCPPWTFLHCDAAGRALNDFRVFIVGFGQMGQAVLKQLIINGQMEGSTFHAEVFDRQMHEERGFFDAIYPSLLQNYDIVLHEAAANSDLFFRQLDDNPPSVVVLCSGDHKHNMELGEILYRKYGSLANRPCLIQCTPDSVLIDEKEYRLGGIKVREMDLAAMELNHIRKGGASAQADWIACTPLDQAGCRAFVNFIPALLYAAGMSTEENSSVKWPPSPEVLENLCRTEHRRWCAFTLAMGYEPMKEDELMRRCEQYRRGEIEDTVSNAAAAKSACLIPWEQLDGLAERLMPVIGRKEDYKAGARANVLAIPDVLRYAAAKEGK